MNDIKDIIGRSIAVKEAVLQSEELLETLQTIIDEIIAVYANGGKVLLCGNGGSAADAQHVAAELSGRFYFDREPLYAEALHVNTSYLTAVANDYDYDDSNEDYDNDDNYDGDYDDSDDYDYDYYNSADEENY